MYRLFATVGLLLPILCLHGHASPLDPAPAVSLDRERQQAFAWMDGLGLPDVRQLKFVKAQLGSVDIGDLEPRLIFKYGFVLEDRNGSFKLLGMDLGITDHQRTAPNEKEHLRVDHAPADLAAYAAAPVFFDQMDRWQRFNGRHSSELAVQVSPETTQLFLAWACARRGQNDQAAAIYKNARTALEANYAGQPPSVARATIQSQAAANIAMLEMNRAYIAFRDPRVSRAELMHKFERINRLFPTSPVRTQACDLAIQLRLMVDEDNARAAQQQQGDKESIAELVYRLRDQFGVHDDRGSGRFMILNDPQSPAARLIAKGYAAVPELLRAIGDKRLTRTPISFNHWYPSRMATILTIGDCAEILLKQISGVSYNDEPLNNSSYALAMSASERHERSAADSLSRAVFSAWHANLLRKGEKQLLIEATSRGDQDSVEQARRLRDRYPNDALPALIAAARTDGPWRFQFVETIRLIAGEGATEFLLREVKEGPFNCRMSAAEGLQERNRPEGLAAMIAEWQDETPRLFSLTQEARTSQRNHAQLAQFLVGSGNAEGILALRKDLRRRPVQQRMDVIRLMTEEVLQEGEKYRTAVEGLLVDCLEDKDERIGVQNYNEWRHRGQSSEPRVCDLAAQTLSEIFTSKYSFNAATAQSARDRRILELRNTWREANNLAPVPVPQPTTFARVPAKTMRPLLDRYRRLADLTETQKRLLYAEIEKHGVGAFWTTLDYRDTLASKQEFDLLDGLAKKIACTVTGVHIAPGSLEPSAELKRRFEALNDSPLEVKSFVPALEASLQGLPESVHGVHITALRGGDGTGIRLTIDLLDRSRAHGPILTAAEPTPTNLTEPAAQALARENAGKNRTDLARRFFWSSRVRIGMGNLQEDYQIIQMAAGQMRFVRIMTMVFTNTQSAAGLLHQPSSTWPSAELRKALNDALESNPGDPIEISIRFTRNGQMPGRTYMRY